MFIVTLVEVILPHENILYWYWGGRGTFIDRIDNLFVIQFWSLLAVAILYILLKKFGANNEKKYILILFLIAQFWTLLQHQIIVVKDDSTLTFSAWDGISRYWGLFSIALFLPYFLGNKLSESLPAKYTEFVSSFFSNNLLVKMLIAQVLFFVLYLLFGSIA
jgi:hypothetical protein